MAITTTKKAADISNGGDKVSLVDGIAYSTDSIGTGQRLVSTTFYDAATVTNNGSADKTGHSGTRLVLLHINVSALTLDTATNITFTLRKLLPDGTSYDDMAAIVFTTTGHKLIMVRADDFDSDVFDRQDLAIGDGNARGGPWGDSLRLTRTWVAAAGGSSSCTVNAEMWAM